VTGDRSGTIFVSGRGLQDSSRIFVAPPEVALLNKLAFENLRQRPVRTCLSVLAIGVEVTMILTLVGISYGTLDETARRALGVGADIIVRPPASSIISLSSSPMSEKLVPFLMRPKLTLPHRVNRQRRRGDAADRVRRPSNDDSSVRLLHTGTSWGYTQPDEKRTATPFSE